jgi:RHS repeat-associated protein
MLETKNGVQTQYRIYGDHLGSMRAVVRVSDGKAVQVMRHGPWGELELDSVASGFARVPFGFAGGIHDDATKLVRFGAREYDARTGRWLSKDEARFGGGENFYEYAGGDPTNFIDRFGDRPSSSSPNDLASGDTRPQNPGLVCAEPLSPCSQRCEEDCTKEANLRYGDCMEILKEKYKGRPDPSSSACDHVRHVVKVECAKECREHNKCE